MKRRSILIVKAGSTSREIRERQGDFEHWIMEGLGPGVPATLVDPVAGEELPDLKKYLGAVITGSHDNITDRLPWMPVLEEWVRESSYASVPILGICFGHQILAYALGGKVDYHQGGLEAGTREIHLTAEGKADSLLGILPSPFPAHVTHSQTVVQLPENAVLLAFNSFERHHAFRVGQHIWGLQFHPEYSAEIMREYLKAEWNDLLNQGNDPSHLMEQVHHNTTGDLIMRRFAEICREKQLSG